MAPNKEIEIPGQEASEEQDIILESFPDLNNEEFVAVSAEIDSIVKKRKKAERRVAVSQIKELAQRYEINLSEVSIKQR